MHYKECVHILRNFRPNGQRRSGNEIGMRVAVHVVQGVERATLDVLVHDPHGGTGPVPPAFEYTFKGENKRIRTRIERARPPKIFSGGDPVAPQQVPKGVRGGDPAYGSGGTPGTAGWFLYLDNRLMCLGNWHVFGETRGKILVETKTRAVSAPGIVEWTVPVQCDEVTLNGWDLALAEVLPANVVPEMAEPGIAFPTELSSGLTVGDGAEYATAGAGHAGWTYGKLTAVWSGWVEFGYEWAYFSNQLQFDPMTVAGDSGSVVIRVEDGSVAGLVFGGDAAMTLANPLPYLGWTWTGTYEGIGTFRSA